MARKLRVEYAGACYHVINRGNYRKDLFIGKGAAEAFQACLGEAARRFGWRVHAFVIMRNHYHLLVETPEPNLSVGMKWLQGTWVMRFNRFRGETGRPFQGRYKALHVEPGSAVAQVAHYIHLNPVRAKVVTPEKLLEHRWSSLPLFVRKARPGYLESMTVLSESGHLPDSAAGWRRYLEYLGFLAEEDAKLREARFGRLSRGWVIGSASFKAGLKKELAMEGADRERFALLGADRKAQQELQTELWEAKLGKAAELFKVRLDQLPSQFSAPEKVKLAALMKAASSASNGWLAQRLQMGSAGNISQYVRRFRLRAEADKRAFKASLSQIMT
jgi:REP element-mobilizing transposase RayT